MKKIFSRRFLAAVMAALCLMAMFPMGAMAAASILGTGNAGDGVMWTITDDSVLRFSGTGAIRDFKDPWDTQGWVFTCKPGTDILVRPTVLIVEEGVTSIGNCALGDQDFTEMILADSIVSIGDSSFWGCKEISKIVLPKSLKKIGRDAFCNCVALTEVTIPFTVTVIEDNAFYLCNKITDVYYTGTREQWDQIQFGILNKTILNAKIHYDYGLPEDPSAWAKTEVNAAIATGLVPENLQQNYQVPVSRGEVATMFVNLLEQSSGENIATIMAEKNVVPNSGAFTDTSDNAVLAANALGIINGTGNGKFDPGGTLTRAQIAAIINRVANVMGVNTSGYTHSFTDVTGHWVSAELGWPSATGIINGVGNNKFDPDAKLTTEQAIAITYRALGVLKG